MKINWHGRAKVLTQQEIQLIFSHGLNNDRDHTLQRNGFCDRTPNKQSCIRLHSLAVDVRSMMRRFLMKE
ncbi:hypothetical protein [Fischerella sp. PCC 9605]|uniref:hypothetical protein n=1 Tax=Fischerella sp. PCC 9605 TaxID=1173024 RepID=UPI0004BA1D11|nr:hypothetical protein [Fischerella sp. PCC 9605]